MEFHIITLFPEFFDSPLSVGILGEAVSQGLITVHTHHLVDFKEDPKKRVDDVPYGGGAGMVMRPEPVARAIEHVKEQHGDFPVIYFTPRGKNFTQSRAEGLAHTTTGAILLCGRYEGVDQRVIESHVDIELQVGSTILTGGEFPALLYIDTLARLVPGVLGNEDSHQEESFSKVLGRKKEYPHYTRPENWRGQSVPEVLLSGHHKKIREWRLNNLG